MQDMPSLTTLTTLPVEILCSILRLLDPIALISASQTCAHFRSIIKPTKDLLAERLLSLELLPEYGGITPTFRSRDNNLQPFWTESSWDDMRWACTNCLRLLDHSHFDNHSLLQLRSRKPPADSEAAKALTSWEPVPFRHNGKRHRRLLKQQRARERRISFLYRMAVSDRWMLQRHVSERYAIYKAPDIVEDFQSLTIDGLSAMTREEEMQLFDKAALAVERIRCGTERHKRRCNECKYRLGVFERPQRFFRGSNRGNATVPVMRSRHFTYGTKIDRWFPGLENLLSLKKDFKDPPIFKIHNWYLVQELYGMYMVRCPQCERWQELRAFYTNGSAWADAFATNTLHAECIKTIKDMQCNGCVFGQSGEGVLKQSLLKQWHAIFQTVEESTAYRMSYGWHIISYCVKLKKFSTWHQVAIREALLDDLPFKDVRATIDGLDLDGADLDDIKNKQHWWRDEVYPTIEQGDGFSNWLVRWTMDYDDIEAQWKWLQAVKRKIAENPDVLVDWAMRVDREGWQYKGTG